MLRLSIAAVLLVAQAFRPAIVPRPVGAVVLAAQAYKPASAVATSIDSLEHAVESDPENLKLAADYRQLAIAGRQFDRAIGLFEKLAKANGSGPNVQVSLALSYVDKVPTSGDMRRLYLGRDAIAALSRSIEQRPSVLAYYVRGVINLYFNNFIFHRAPRGVADLQQALTLATPDTPRALVARTYASLGDGYWRLEQPDKARQSWKAGAARFPDHPALRVRAGADEQKMRDAVSDALDSRNRVDTSLRDLFPER